MKRIHTHRKWLVGIVAFVGFFILVAGGLLMTNLALSPKKYFSKILYQSEFQKEVKEIIRAAVEEIPEGDTLDLPRLTPFAWDRVCIFGMARTDSNINQALGITWLDQREVVDEDSQLFVFTQNQEVVQHLNFSPALIQNRNEMRRQEICLSAAEASFLVGGRDWQGLRIKGLLLREDSLPGNT
jgi:hypothetical protein